MSRFLRVLFILLISSASVAAQQLYINEITQGSAGSKEYVEFIVSGTRSCTDSTLDIRNYIFDDNPGWYTTTGVGTGCYRFANISNWANVKYGSIILIYNSADKNVLLTAPDDSTDVNGDGVYILSSTNSFLQVNTASPTSSTTYDYATAAAGTWTAPTSTSWTNLMALGNSGDAFVLINPAVSTTTPVHSFAYGTATGGAKTPNIFFASFGGGTVAYNNGIAPLTQSSWSTGTATTSAATSAESPGAGNNAANTALIASAQTPYSNRIYVDGSVASAGTGASWASPYKRLTDALQAANAASCAKEIWVKSGTYYPTTSTNRDSSFRIIKNGLKVYGGFAGTETALSQRNISANPTILSGDIGTLNDSTDNLYHVFVIAPPASLTAIDTSTVLSGFTITRGEGNTAGGLVTYGGAGAFRDNGGGLNICARNALTCSPRIDSCTFTKNTSDVGGGLLTSCHSGGTSKAIITACTFSDNRAISNGGGFAFYGDGTSPVLSGQLKNCIFNANVAGSAGSAMWINVPVATGKSFLKLDTCSFAGNGPGTTGNMWGTVYIRANGGTTDTVQPAITGCSFSGNSAYRGGGIHLENGAAGIMTGCTFSSNTALNLGGGLSVYNASSAVSGCSFSGNTAVNGTSYASGGGIAIYTSSVKRYHAITNCSFTGNKAYNDGGAILAQDSNVIDMKGITSSGNRAQGGGFMQTQIQYTLSMTVDSSSFSADTATVYGAIFRNGNPGTTTYTRCRFLNSYGYVTGAFDQYLNGAQVFKSCLFSGNKSDNYGAAVHAYAVNDTFTNCVFTDNTILTASGNGGGAIHSNNSSTVVTNNCTFYNNTAATTGSYAGSNHFSWEGSPAVVLNNTIVWGAAQLTQAGTGGTRVYNNSLLKNVALSSPNLSVDPNFVNAASPVGTDGIWGTGDDGLRLTQCSPAINAGDNSRIPSGITTDFASALRVQQTNVDMGAYESAYAGVGFNPFVTLSTAPTPAQCGSSTIAFYANLQSPGGTPGYQWYRNGTAAGTNSQFYSGTFSSNDSVTVQVTDSWCPSYNVGASQRVAISSAPAVSISGPGNPSCAGATLTANSSLNPLAIQWNLNGAPLVMQNSSYGVGTTVAGNGTAGNALSQINAPWGMFVDRSRNVYVAEQGGNRVTKWAPPYSSGVLVAGTGTAGAAPHQLNSTGDVYVDDYGYIYIADRFNYRVQRWAPGANTAVTVAGGNGSGTGLNQFNYPASLVVDDSGNIYVTDFNNHRVMRWAPGAATGMVVAGTGTAGSALNQLNFPSYLFLDKSTRNLYITDEFNHRIVMWAPSATAGVVVAGGNGQGSNGNQLNGPRGVASDAAGNLYINDGGNNRIVVWQSGAQAGTTVAAGNGAGSGANQLNFPLDIDVDSSGNIYVADGSNHRVQRFSPSVINTITAVSPGSYTATITPANGCPATTASYSISPLPLSTVDTSSPKICVGDSVSITAASAAVTGNALDFDGSNNNYATIPAGTGNNLGGATAYTVSAWIYPRSNAQQNILFKGLGCSTFSQWTLGIGGLDGTIQPNPGKWFFSFIFNSGGSLYYAPVASSANVALNLWSYVSVTCDGAKLRMYVNGSLAGETSAFGATPYTSTEALYLGQDPGCGGRNVFNGRLDEVSVWSVAKSQADIGGMMKGLIPASAAGLLSYYRFDENNGNKIYDAAPGAQYGTLTGSAYTRQIPSTAPINNAASGPVTYNWSPATGLSAVSGATVKASPAGTTQYTLTTTHTASGCSNIARVTVDVNPLPTAGVTPNGTLISCTGAPLTLVADSALGYSWQWYNGGVLIGGANGRTYTPAASGTYTVRVGNASGCFLMSAVVNVTVVTTVTPSVTIVANPSGPVCSGTNVVFTATPVAGGSGAQYQWLRNGVAVGVSSATYSDATLANGSTVQVRIISNAPCRTADTAFSNIITISVNPTPAISGSTSTNPTTCGGTNGSITLTGLVNGTSYTIYYTQNGVAQSPVMQTAVGGAVTLSGLPNGSYTNISVSTAAPCASNVIAGPILLSPPSTPAGPTAGNSGPICAGSTLGLTSNTITGASYNWTGPNGFTSAAQNPFITGAQTAAAGVYQVTVTVAGCTSNPGSTTAIVNPTPVIASVTGTNPATCGGSNGSIAISGLTASSVYTVNFFRNGTALAAQTLTANAGGIVAINGLSAGSYTGFVVTLGSCPSATTGNVTLSDPAAPATPVISSNSAICAGSTLSLTGPSTSGVIFSWNGPNGFFSSQQSPSIASATAAASGTYTLTLTSLTSGCISTPASLSATVNAIPVIGAATSVNPLNCGGASGSITLNGLNASTIYTVSYLRNGSAQSAGISSSAGGVLTISGLNAGVYSSITVSLNNCSSSAVGPFTLTDPATPAAPAASSNSPVCQGGTLNLSVAGAAGASFSWAGPASFASASATPTLANLQAANAGTYSVTQTVAGCVSPAATTTVVMNTVPAAPGAISGNAAPCSGQSYTYAIGSVATASSYVWTTPAGNGWSTAGSSGTSIGLTTGTVSGALTVVAVNGCGNSTPASLTLAVNNIPAQPGSISGPASICSGNSATYFISAVPNTTSYTWSVPAGWSGGGATSISIFATASANSGNVTVTATNVCGTSTPQTLAVTAISLPAQPGTIGGLATPCVNSVQPYSITPVTGASSYAWSYPAGGTPAWAGGSTAAGISLTVGTASGNVSVAAVNMCGTGPARSLPVTVTQLPAQPAAISGKSAPCIGSTELYSIPAVTGATSYSWIYPASWAGASTSNAINVLVGASGGSISVAATNACGNGPAQTLAVVTVPVATTGVKLTRSSPSDTICSGVAVTFTATPTNGGSTPVFIFRKNGTQVGSSGNSYTDYSLANGDKVTVTMTSSLPCVTATQVSDSIKMTVSPQIVPGVNINTVPPTTLCAGATLTFTTNIVGGGNNPAYQWYKNGVSLGVTTASYTTSALSNGDTIQVLLASSEQCPAVKTVLSNKVGLKVNPVVNPTVVITANPSGPIAAGTLVTFTSSQTGGGQTPGYQWLKNGKVIPGETNNSYTTSSLQGGDRIALRMQSYDLCAQPSVVTSNVITMDMPTSVRGAGAWEGSVTLYPNPTNGRFTITASWLPVHTGKRTAVDVLNAVGQVVYHTELKPDRDKWSHDVWLGDAVANGLYLVRISSEDGMRAALPLVMSR